MDDFDSILKILREGDIDIKGEFRWGSNYTFLVDVALEANALQAVYKPTRGERPLWDFPASSLGQREVAAYLVSQALGWELVPPTVYRRNGPIGSGSLQVFIDHNPEYHYFTFSRVDVLRLQPVVVFDVLINNADRKGSHVLIGPDNHLWLIDHGVSFHVEDKLRSVIWDFVGQEIPSYICDDLERFRRLMDSPSSEQSAGAVEFNDYLSQSELEAIIMRTEELLKTRRYPAPDSQRRSFPWPQI